MSVSDRHSPPVLSNLHTEKGSPIFILGIMPRSGTNFLHRLLCQHPECGAINSTPVREDYLTHHGHWLTRYTKRLKWQWGHWGANEEFVAPLSKGIGEGITDFLSSLTSAKYVVTKTPSVANIDTFFEFFPHARLLIIVRDGRSVVASGMSGFGWNFETATRAWAQAARRIKSFEEKNQQFKNQYMVVHYESLSSDTVNSLQEIFNFLELDIGEYDFESALETPIYGSSYARAEGKSVSWAPVEKREGVVAINRWEGWSPFLHQRFNKSAGKELKLFAYEPVTTTVTLLHACRHLLIDVGGNTRRTGRLIFSALKEGVKAFRNEWKGESKVKVNLKK